MKINLKRAIDSFNEKYPEKRKITKLSLSEKIGCSKNTLSNYESGKRGKSIILIKKICDELECSFNDLID